MNAFELTLDLDKRESFEGIVIRQGNKSGTAVMATIRDHGEALSGAYTCRISFKLPDHEHYYRETATLVNGVATVTVDETYAASVVGRTKGYFELLQGSSVIASTGSFPVVILPSAQDGAELAESYDSAIQEALEELDAAIGGVRDIVEDAVSEELAEHPEWTSTVIDNSITPPKLNENVALTASELAAILV